MSTRIELENLIAKIGFLHVVQLYDDQQLLTFLFSLLEIDTLKDTILSELQNKFNKHVLSMVSVQHQKQPFDLTSRFEQGII